MTTIVKNYHDKSSIDYLAHFSHLWIGFNRWYDQNNTNGGDRAKCLAMVNNADLQRAFTDEIQGIDDIDQLIVDEVRKFAHFTITDQNGNEQHTRRDTTTFEFRLQGNNTNSIIDFLEFSSQQGAKLRGLVDTTSGIAFLQPTSASDPLFRQLQLAYHRHMANADNIALPFDATTGIPNLLNAIQVEMTGRLLLHNPTATTSSTGIVTLTDLFGSGYSQGPQEEAAANSFQPLLYRYLYSLYKFRCYHFHGELDPTDVDNQQLAQLAHSSLFALMTSALP